MICDIQWQYNIILRLIDLYLATELHIFSFIGPCELASIPGANVPDCMKQNWLKGKNKKHIDELFEVWIWHQDKNVRVWDQDNEV